MSTPSMKPVSRPRTLPSTMQRQSVNGMSQTTGVPVIAVPTRLPTAPIAKASSIETMPTVTDEIALARITRLRCGTRVNVVSPLRWLHSLVTDRIATIGRMTAIGKPMAAPKFA